MYTFIFVGVWTGTKEFTIVWSANSLKKYIFKTVFYFMMVILFSAALACLSAYLDDSSSSEDELILRKNNLPIIMEEEIEKDINQPYLQSLDETL